MSFRRLGTRVAVLLAALAVPAVLVPVAWYNDVHRHGGLGLHTAADVHYGRAAAVQAGRPRVLTAAYLAHPERFVRSPPAPPGIPAGSWINPPEDHQQQKEAAAQ